MPLFYTVGLSIKPFEVVCNAKVQCTSILFVDTICGNQLLKHFRVFLFDL